MSSVMTINKHNNNCMKWMEEFLVEQVVESFFNMNIPQIGVLVICSLCTDLWLKHWVN